MILFVRPKSLQRARVCVRAGEWVGGCGCVCALASVYTPLHYTLLCDVEFTAKTRRRLAIRIILLQYALGNPVHKSRL